VFNLFSNIKKDPNNPGPFYITDEYGGCGACPGKYSEGVGWAAAGRVAGSHGNEGTKKVNGKILKLVC
jgi:hypothetical protein